MASHPLSSDRELVGSAEDDLRASYPTPVPEDLHGSLDPGLGDGTGLLFQEYRQIQDVPAAIERGPFGVAGCGLARGGFGNAHLSVGHGTPDTSPLPQLPSPGYTTVQSPSMASEMFYDGICSPAPASDMMYPGMGLDVDARLHHPRSHEYVNPAEISPAPSFRYGSQSTPVAYAGFEYQQNHPPPQGSSLPFRDASIGHESVPPGANNMRGTQSFFVATDYVHDSLPRQNPAFPHCRHGVWQPGLDSQHLSRVEPAGQGLLQVGRTPPAGSIRCPECNTPFHNEGKLSEHVQNEACSSTACLFSFAGCQSRFKNKNEWKRHVNTIDVQHECYICKCAKRKCAESRIRSARPLPPTFPSVGKAFNRKDLYKEHQSREEEQHLSPERAKTRKRLLRAQREKVAQEALHYRIELPESMDCFVEGCSDEYEGQGAWGRFLDHVFEKHLEPASGPLGDPVALKDLDDVKLTAFGLSAGFLAKTESGWRLLQPLEAVKPDSNKTGARKAHGKQVSSSGRRARR
ncbi:hypothetical protein TOPH_05622 [Tolypocladium ophioglossoides CBS 100239]|uniref:C2H2-type domain-containing protein n=1 Tax=Tolypocladium ophioglossoides (strain CBS 100239) TaxID=1163406 RepID=A0A0L0N6A7_TOLOC|nr:hypothetical protein TOPH_05622 [Tolypocladium ophioglossoides CBS 100239]